MMSLTTKLVRQMQRPEGWLGRMNLSRMNKSHSDLTDWGLTHVTIANDATALDIGCGGGRTIAKLADRASMGNVYGIDHSPESVALSRQSNIAAVERGRVDVRQGSVSQLPFADDTFDLATAIETHFYWPDLRADMREILRVLKPGGTLVIVAEVYKGGKHDAAVRKLAALMAQANTSYANLTVAEHRALFSDAGYADAQVVEDYDRGWICATGRKTLTLAAV